MPNKQTPTVFNLTLAGFLIFSVATWYLDHVLASEYGKRDPFYFFLKPILPNAIYRCTFLPKNTSAIVPYKDESADVAEERAMVENKSWGERQPAVVIEGLFKTYGNFDAVNNISYAVDENQCFVMLGHNGAGKSTTLSMLTGLTDVSRGDATVFGYSVKTDMSAISGFMGVCPQHDVLWDQLSGREHLQMFAELKGIPANRVEAEVDARLADVLLTNEADNPAGSYSGGMKRRLSIAIALLVSPSVRSCVCVCLFVCVYPMPLFCWSVLRHVCLSVCLTSVCGVCVCV
jgi:ATP-binding cassette subfamily A (ABC1) protein 3